MLKLILSIKRSTFRENDPRASKANAEAKAKRPLALARGNYKCQGCGYTTSSAEPKMDIHHKDDDHHNNSDENLVCACHACHAYQHVGQVGGKDSPGEDLGDKTILAEVPELSAADFNLLQRAIGAALNDPKEAVMAERLLNVLAERIKPVVADFRTCEPIKFAQAMAQLSPQEYESREEVVKDLRLIFKTTKLKDFGGEFLADNPSMPVESWEAIERSVMSRKAARL